MKKVLVTGGSGTVGKAFIEEYYGQYEFYSISRNESYISELKQQFPDVNVFIGDICDFDHLVNIYSKVRPDIVVHAAAIKHINLAEENPSRAVEVNLVGSLNVIKASVRLEVPLTIGVSTDKACDPDSVYGYSKKIMERMFSQYHNHCTKFVCTRFANVAKSNGSVIPYWVSEAEKGNKLKLTDMEMNRLMFSSQEAAQLIHKAIDYSSMNDFFVLCRIMKNVNLFNLAKFIGDDVDVIGKRPGEKLNEVLVTEKELPNTLVDGDYVLVFDQAWEILLEKFGMGETSAKTTGMSTMVVETNTTYDNEVEEGKENTVIEYSKACWLFINKVVPQDYLYNH